MSPRSRDRRSVARRRVAAAVAAIGLGAGSAGDLGADVAGASASDEARAPGAAEAIVRRAERGPVSLTLSLAPPEPRIGDVLRLELEAVAEPGVELLMPAFGEALGRFEIVDFAPSERLDDAGRTVARQVYRLHPTRSGASAIPSLRVEFVDRRPGRDPAPPGEDAWELLTDRLAFDVAPILEADAPLELRPPHPDLGPRRGPGPPLWAWLLGATLAVAAIAPFAWRAWQRARARERQRSAYDVARGALDALLAEGRPDEHADAEAMDAFYVRLSAIVRTYLEDRFGLRSPELTTQEFLAEMGRSPDLARSHQRMLRDFLEQADLVKFAGVRPDAEAVAASIATAERFLEDTRDLARAFDGDDGRAEAPAHG